MPVNIHEQSDTLTAQAVEGKPGRLLVTLITPGHGSSGYYSTECLEQAAADRVFPAGLHMYLDHPTEAEEEARPVRSVKDLGAALVEDARWDAAAQALVAEAEVFSQHRLMITEMQAHIGTSIRASAEVSESNGQRNIDRIVASKSVDFVTHAGRGGSFDVLESAVPSQVVERAVERGIAEATANDQREALSQLIKDAHALPKSNENTRIWAWLRDFDETTAWFEIENGDQSGLYQQTYSRVDDIPTELTGTPIEVRQVTKYVPVNPAGQSIPTQESQEDTMPNIEESELARLREDAGRVTVLESERDAERTRANESERRANVAEARTTATERARTTVRAANATLPAATVDRIVAEATRDIPLTDAGALDETAFDAAVESARTAEETYLAGLAESTGSGGITGFGPSGGGDGSVSLEEFDNTFAPTPKGA